MSNGDYTMTGVIIDTYELLRNSPSGNGRMLVTMYDSDGDRFQAQTMTDACGVVTDISNEQSNRAVPKDQRYTVLFTRAGKIRHITRQLGDK
jgi:hypothetical protein